MDFIAAKVGSQMSLYSFARITMPPCELDEKQKIIFQKFAECIQDCKLPDQSEEYLLKWLVARKFNIQAAETMLRTCLEWRQTFEIDKILDSPPNEVLDRYFPMAITGVDKSGGPVWINAYGRVDLLGLFKSITKKDYLRNIIYQCEIGIREMRNLSVKSGKYIGKETLVVDLADLNLRDVTQKIVMDVAIELTKLSQGFYPENLSKVFVINAPSVVNMVFSMMKPFMDQITIDKVKFFGHDQNQWKPALLEWIDADQLPAMYGGTQTDSDGNPMCLDKLVLGGPIPSSYYFCNNPPVASIDMESVEVKNGSKRKLTFDIEKPGSIIRWKFISYDGDMAFHIFYQKDDKDIDVVPWSRVDSHIAKETGHIVCLYKTTYTIIFDNSFSYMRSKRLSYSVVMEEP